MKYKNTKTGAIIDSPCIISGGDWVTEETPKVVEALEVEEIVEFPQLKHPLTPEEVEKVEEVIEVEEEIEGIEGITIKEIKQELDAFGIKYNPRAKKQELYDLMIKGR